MCIRDSSLPLRSNGRIFLVFMRHFSFSCGNPARPRPGENTAYLYWSANIKVYYPYLSVLYNTSNFFCTVPTSACMLKQLYLDKCKSSNFDAIPVSICMVSCQCSQYQGKTFLHWIGQMPINDFRKINIGSVLNEVARVVKLLQTVLVLYSFITGIT